MGDYLHPTSALTAGNYIWYKDMCIKAAVLSGEVRAASSVINYEPFIFGSVNNAQSLSAVIRGCGETPGLMALCFRPTPSSNYIRSSSVNTKFVIGGGTEYANLK